MSTGAAVVEDGAQLLDAAALQRATVRLAHEILERHGSDAGLLLAGIRTRGAPLAARVAAGIERIGGAAPEVAVIDVSGFRDDRPHDLDERDALPVRRPDGEPVDVAGRTIVLVDDVLFTGRSVRAAIDAVMSQGRPAAIEVLALVDRGHRELPVRATYVGKNVPTSADDRVLVRLYEVDGVDGAWLVSGRAR